MKTSAIKSQNPARGNKELPVHSLAQTEFPVFVKDIAYKNPYDFTREHRHTYFEIFFFEKGGGRQLIDFTELPVRSNSCYIVFPQQVHLLQRDSKSSGMLVQFREECIPSEQIKNLLRQASFGMNPAVLFERDAQKMKQLEQIVLLLKDATEKSASYSHEITTHYLSALLFQLMQFSEVTAHYIFPEDRKLLYSFQLLLEEQFLKNHSVQYYTSLLNTTERKLSDITKKYLGLNPLHVIHNRLLLEAKRMILFEDTSHKEIAFLLNFDSPASFSQFIKNKTGLAPSALKKQLVKIHK
ncbi:MAG TPA: helix-turn-helix domain-containing protein [Bacteroidia bacterium]|nr:helix-turn-helix domain-containing protein [Bacteroidia bacterium]